MSYIGVIGAGRLDEADSSLGLLACQKKAVKLFSEGADMHMIKCQTGWELGVDKKWKYEVDDAFRTTAVIEDHIKMHFGEPLDIRYFMRDTALLIAYPAFSRLRLYGSYTHHRGVAGYFDPRRYGMVVCMGSANSPFEFQSEGVLLHEVQHLIQAEEGFARGGSADATSRYLRLAGEVEARNICHRHPLTKEQRLSSLRTDTQDVPDEKQIIVV